MTLSPANVSQKLSDSFPFDVVVTLVLCVVLSWVALNINRTCKHRFLAFEPINIGTWYENGCRAVCS